MAVAALLCASSMMVTQMRANDVVTGAGFLYLSGTLPQDDAGRVVSGGDVGAQTRHVIERARARLTSSGSSLEQVVAVTVYLKSAADFAAMNDAYRTFWPKDPPTRTTVIADLGLPGALVEMSMIAVAAGAERTVMHPSNWMTSPNPYSYAIKSGDTVFLSGLVSRNGRDNSVVPGDVTTQTKVVMDNAAELLKAAGMSLANVVSARVYLPDVASFPLMNDAYRAYFPSAPPARATVQAGLAGAQYQVEITMIASSASREVVNDGRPPSPNLSTAIRAGSRVYLSGSLGNTPENRGDAAAQTRETLKKLRSALSAAGCSPADVVDALIYVTDLTKREAIEAEYRAFFDRGGPATTTVKTGLVAPDALVEIMMTAVKR
jgi:reactive intermediate/imine deaminase